MHYKLRVSKYTAIKQLLSSYIRKSLSIYTLEYRKEYTKDEKLPLYKGRDDKKILYISGVALWLSKSQNQEPMEIASAIASHLLADCGDVFSVQIVPPGSIHFELSHSALGAWLQSLTIGDTEETRETTPSLQSTTNDRIRGASAQADAPQRWQSFTESARGDRTICFPVQYAHARCCSLVLLAHREKLIKLQEPLLNTGSSVWNLICPQPIPWLNYEGKLHLKHSAETSLISKLVQVVDDLESDAFGISINWEKAALDLSQAFDTFWCKCRIWGEVRTTSPELAQARLGLVMATQSVLKYLLEAKLGLLAPWEL